jgi:tetratricopeptide (TPR) repeat protein
MRKTIAFWSFALLAGLLVSASAAQAAVRVQSAEGRIFARQLNAPPQAAKAPSWKSREEYDAYMAMANEKDANKRVQLADAFLTKYPNSDFKEGAYIVEMQTYREQQQMDKAIDAAHKALQANPDSLPALNLLAFVFPFTYKGDAPDHDAKLAEAESEAKHGLELVQKIQKPANVPEDQFNQQIKGVRAIFNGDIGFVDLQRKDYAGAITADKAAAEDNPSDDYVYYRMGLAYLYSEPHDYDNGIWYLAHAVALAKAAKDPNAAEFEKYLKKTYVDYHGNEDKLQDIETQAAANPNPPSGFKVGAMEAPKHTGNQLVDGFNDMTFPLKFGGETAQKQWDALKGQPFEFGGSIDSVEKGTDPGTYIVKIDILDSSKATPGVYDIALKDSTQPNVKNLQPGDLIRFKGTMDSYTATPNVMVTVVGTVTDPSPLPDQPPAKEKAAPTKKKPATRKPST